MRGSIADACGSKSIELRFVNKIGRLQALSALESGSAFRPMNATRTASGSELPVMRFHFDGAKVWRALAKIAVNLLHHCCERTPVNYQSFPMVIAEIRGKQKFPLNRMEQGGFVWASQVATMRADDGGHAIRLYHAEGHWNVAFAFFGGQCGAVVRFPGPSGERWTTLDIRAPLKSTDWAITPMSFSVAMRFDFEWLDLRKIIPRDEWEWNHDAS